MWLKAIANPATARLAIALSEGLRAQNHVPVADPSATGLNWPVRTSWAAQQAPMWFGRPGCYPVFLVSERAAVGGPGKGALSMSRPNEAPWAASCEPLLERFATAAAGDQDAALGVRPRDRAADPGMAGELAVPVPDGAL